MNEILLAVAFIALWLVCFFLAYIVRDHQIRLEYLEEQQDRKDGRPVLRIPLKRSFIFGLVSSEQILDPPIDLEPCKKCGSTVVYLHYCRIFWLNRWLVYCPDCKACCFIQKSPESACVEWNNNPPYEK